MISPARLIDALPSECVIDVVIRRRVYLAPTGPHGDKWRVTVAATSTFGGDRVHVVKVDRELSPTGNHEPLGLPCFG
jgi:hypothetical protein